MSNKLDIIIKCILNITIIVSCVYLVTQCSIDIDITLDNLTNDKIYINKNKSDGV